MLKIIFGSHTASSVGIVPFTANTDEMVVKNFQELATFNVPYIEKQMDQFSGKLIRLPEREEIPIDAQERLIVEYYSK